MAEQKKKRRGGSTSLGGKGGWYWKEFDVLVVSSKVAGSTHALITFRGEAARRVYEQLCLGTTTNDRDNIKVDVTIHNSKIPFSGAIV